MSGTYQSRVFTFISQRSNRLKDACVQGFRHIKVAVVWSGQILLYPLHLLAQTTKIFQPRLSPPPPQRSFPEPSADINIEQALDLVAGVGYPIVITADAAAPLANRRASTVDDLAIIDENQWNKTHIDTAIADYPLEHLRHREIIDSPRASGQVKSPKPIVRGLSSLLIDRQLVLVTIENELLDILTISQQQEIRRRIGGDLANAWEQWHQNNLAKSHSTPQISTDPQLLLTHKTANRQLIGDTNNSSNPPAAPQETLHQRWHNWLQSFQPKAPSENLAIAPELISQTQPKAPAQLPAIKYSFTPQPPTLDRFWELPQLPPIVETQPPPQAHPVRDTIAKLQPDWLKQWWNYYRDYLYIPSKTDSQIVHQPADFQLIPIAAKPEIKSFKQTQKQHDLVDRNPEKIAKNLDPDSEYDYDWIEVDSEIIGYSQSPIAKFLAWLDRIVLRVENWLIKIWQLINKNSAQNQ